MSDISGALAPPDEQEPIEPSTPEESADTAPAGDEDVFDQQDKLARWSDAANIADEFDDTKLGDIGQRVKREYDIDETSRSDWVTKTEEALKLAMQVADAKSYPWPRAANVIYPLMTTSAQQFAARAYPAIVAGKDVVKGVVVGTDNGIPMMNPQTGQPMIGPDGQPAWVVPPGTKRMRAARIGEHMSWQLLDEMTEWESETDYLLHLLPITGCVFRKSYFDPGKGRNVSLTISPLNVVINYHAKSMATAPRVTEKITFYPLEITEMERAGMFRKIIYTSEQENANDEDAPRPFLEQHRYLDLDEDGYPEPYIVTIHEATSQVVRIRARYEKDAVHFKGTTHEVAKIEPTFYYTKYDFMPNPEGGIYGLGFGQLLKPVNEAVNTTLNQLLDAGHLANTGGGFIGRGLSMHSGAVRFTPGEYKVVNAAGSVIKDNIVPLSFPGPSMVLFQLLGLLIEAGKDIAAVKDVLTGDQDKHNVPATTTLALIEQGLKVFTAIYKRVHRSLKEELAKLYKLNTIYLPEDMNYRVGNDWKSIKRDDYASASGVEPVSDPTMVSDMQRMGKAQFLMQFANDPFFDGMEVRRRMLDAAMIERPEVLLRPPQPNPEFIAKAMEVQIKAQREKAAEMKDLAQSILFFAQSDALVGDMHLAWVQQSLEAWKAQFDAASSAGGPENAMGGAPQSPVPHPGGPPPLPSPTHPGVMPGAGGPQGPGDIAGTVHLSVNRHPQVGASQ